MADISQELLARANEVAERLDAKSGQLKQELLEIQIRTKQIEAALHNADVANKRLLNYRPTLGSDYQCPDCFIKNEVRSSLRAIPGKGTHDLFKCPTCKVEISALID
jgi:hypothetical protein